MTPGDLRNLIDWLGEVGASVGLERGHLTNNELRELAESMNIKVSAKISRKELVGLVVSKGSQRIDRSIQELLAMGAGDLLEYFERVHPSKAELLSILNDLDFRPGSEAQKGLYKYAARQIAETGMFQRVATNNQSDNSRSDSHGT